MRDVKNRKDVCNLLNDPNTKVLSYSTVRDFENFLLNRVLEDDAKNFHAMKSTEPQTVVLVVQTRQLNQHRAGQLL